MSAQQTVAACQQKKIVILANFATDRVNGAYTVIENIALHTNKLGYRCELWGLSTEKDLNAYLFYRHFDDSLFKFKVSNKLRQQLIADKDDIVCVNLHSVFTPVNIAIAKLVKSLGITLCLTSQGGYHDFSFKRNFIKKAIFTLLFERQFLKSIDYFFIHGRQEASFIKRYSAKPCYTLLNGTPAVNTQKTNYNDAVEGTDKIRLLFLGRLDPLHKGLDILIESLTAFKPGEVELTIAGPQFTPQAQAQLLKQVADMGLSQTISINGPVYGQQEKEQLYSSHHVFVHTSRWEGMPTGVIEALAYGMPVLVSKGTNLGDVVATERLGVVAEQLSPIGLAAAIRRVLNNPAQLRIFAENAYHKAPFLFNWPSIAQQYTGYVMDECIKKSEAQPDI